VKSVNFGGSDRSNYQDKYGARISDILLTCFSVSFDSDFWTRSNRLALCDAARILYSLDGSLIPRL